jgi:hypothetical protein
MKRNFAIALIALSTLAGVGKAVAQEQAVKATVPFEFTVGGKVLPADTYTVSSPSEGLVVIRSDDRHFTSITTGSFDDREVKGGKLVFAKYGDQYFLHEVICPAVGLHSRIPTSKLEKRVRTQEAMAGGGAPVMVSAW